MTPEQSVSSMIPVIESRGIQHSGTFWTWEGKVYWIRRSESTGDADTRCNSLIRGKTASILAERRMVRMGASPYDILQEQRSKTLTGVFLRLRSDPSGKVRGTRSQTLKIPIISTCHCTQPNCFGVGSCMASYCYYWLQSHADVINQSRLGYLVTMRLDTV